MTRNRLDQLKESTDPVVQELIKELDFYLPHLKTERPTKTGDYLVLHYKYGPCIWGFTLKDGWGDYSSSLNPTNDPGILAWAELPFDLRK